MIIWTFIIYWSLFAFFFSSKKPRKTRKKHTMQYQKLLTKRWLAKICVSFEKAGKFMWKLSKHLCGVVWPCYSAPSLCRNLLSSFHTIPFHARTLIVRDGPFLFWGGKRERDGRREGRRELGNLSTKFLHTRNCWVKKKNPEKSSNCFLLSIPFFMLCVT